MQRPAVLLCLLLATPAVLGARSTAGSLWSLLRPWTAAAPSDSSASSQPVQGWAVWDGKSKFSFATEKPGNALAPAHASYSHAREHASGFGQLRVTTDAAFPNEVQMAAAGYLEGWLTAEDIANHEFNQRSWVTSQTGNNTARVYDWLMEHHAWLAEQLERQRRPASASAAGGADAALRPFWEAVGLVMAQLQGILDGYNARAAADGQRLNLTPMSLRDMLALNTMGDMDDLLSLLFPEDPQLGLKHLATMEPRQLASRLATRGHCSVLIKVTPDLSDIMLGHVTWWTYAAMNRIYKHMKFNLHGAHFKSRTMSMSSYPGLLSSMDDFYILGEQQHLIVTETSNGVLDPKVWQLVKPQAALSWQRVLAANWLSASGEEWAHWLQQYNSGTYNNAYQIVDLKRFIPGSELQEGLLTVVEQMPGLVLWGDQTQTLERGYFPSYNVPFFPEIYNRSGYPSLKRDLREQQQLLRRRAAGPVGAAADAYDAVLTGLSYQLAPRAKISRRDQGAVSDLATLKAFMRSNSWATDPLAGGSPWGAICGRGDVDPVSPTASGCNDAKVTNFRLAMANAAEAVNGPTPGTGNSLGPFKWGARWAGTAHRGQFEVFDFEFELQQP